MQVCANCGHTNRPGILFCENCGTSLTGKAAVGTTKSFEDSSLSGTGPLSAAGTDYFMPNAVLRIEIEGGPEPILIKPRQELIFGRRDPATGAMPDIDLTPYAGYRMGVSRRHAAIRSADESHLDIWDLGSSNGTFLNGQRLNAHRPYRLRDGDRLRLGQMIIRLFFQPPESQVSPDATGEMDALRSTNEELLGETAANQPVDAGQPSGGSETAHIEESALEAPVAGESGEAAVAGDEGGPAENLAPVESLAPEASAVAEESPALDESGAASMAEAGEPEAKPDENAAVPDEPVIPPPSE